MKLQRITPRSIEDPENVGQFGVVEVQYKDGRIEELAVSEVAQITFHIREA